MKAFRINVLVLAIFLALQSCCPGHTEEDFVGRTYRAEDNAEIKFISADSCLLINIHWDKAFDREDWLKSFQSYPDTLLCRWNYEKHNDDSDRLRLSYDTHSFEIFPSCGNEIIHPSKEKLGIHFIKDTDSMETYEFIQISNVITK